MQDTVNVYGRKHFVDAPNIPCGDVNFQTIAVLGHVTKTTLCNFSQAIAADKGRDVTRAALETSNRDKR